MEIRFCISGTVVFSTESNVIPPIGSDVTIRTETYKKGLQPGTLLNFRISEDFPPHIDYTDETVYIDVDGWEVLQPHNIDQQG